MEGMGVGGIREWGDDTENLDLLPLNNFAML